MDTRYRSWKELTRGTVEKLERANATYAGLNPVDPDRHTEAVRELRAALATAEALFHSGDASNEALAITLLRDSEEEAHALLKLMREDFRQDLSALVAAPGGPEVLDEMVEDTKVLMPKLSGLQSERTTFLQEAMKARFGLTTVQNQIGPGGRDNLKRAYQIMSRVPESHTLGNQRLDVLKLKPILTRRVEASYGGVYDPNDNEIDVIVAHVIGSTAVDPDDTVPEHLRPEPGLEGFQGTVLHEVGHAFDAKEGIMAASAGTRTALGGWTIEEPTDIAWHIVRGTSIAKDHPEFPPDFIYYVLFGVLDRHGRPEAEVWAERQTSAGLPLTAEALTTHLGVVDAKQALEDERLNPTWPGGVCPSDERGRFKSGSAGRFTVTLEADARREANKLVKELIDLVVDGVPVDVGAQRLLDQRALYTADMPPLKPLRSHRGYKIVEALHKHRKGTYYQTGRAGAEANQVGDITYTVDSGTFYSYSMAARNLGVSKYQFRAPAEFFAELYMFFFAGKLPDSHPLYGQLAALM
ncbi:MAG: hypothetical protein H6740_21470 [Alphaproteobacteria bacterium]|nr:hypothetical protein [Alphaproteobacteria bacterium]